MRRLAQHDRGNRRARPSTTAIAGFDSVANAIAVAVGRGVIVGRGVRVGIAVGG